MIKQEPKRTRILGSPGLLPIKFVKHAVHKITKCFEKEEPLGYWCLWLIDKPGTIIDEKYKKWQSTKYESNERNQVWCQFFR